MDNQDSKLSEQQNQYLQEQLEKGVAYDEMTRSKGFEHIKVYVATKLAEFTNQALMVGFQSLDEYREAKGEVNGLRKLLNHIESSIQTLQDERNKQQAG